MVKGVGIDEVSIYKIKRILQYSPRFLTRYFSEREILAALKSKLLYHTIAGKFAAKEAFLKALGKGIFEGIAMKEIEILNDPSGKPFIKYKSKDLSSYNIFISISHNVDNAIAIVILS